MNRSEHKSVLITDASSGIGRASVARMLRSEWRVFASVRKGEDGDRLRTEFGNALVPVLMDVTDQPSIIAGTPDVTAHLHTQGLDSLEFSTEHFLRYAVGMGTGFCRERRS